MSLVLWTSEDDGLELGPSLEVLAAFGRMARMSSQEYPELYGVPHADDEPVEEQWLAKVAEQARAFLDEYGSKLEPFDRRMLAALAGGGEEPQSADALALFETRAEPEAGAPVRDGDVELVEIEALHALRGYDRAVPADYVEKVREAPPEALTIAYDPARRQAVLADGNHRLVAGREAGYSHLPAEVWVKQSIADEDAHHPPRQVPGHDQDALPELPRKLAPSQIGLPVLRQSETATAAAPAARPLRHWEQLMTLDTIEAELDEARARVELRATDEALVAARRIAKRAAGRGRLSAPRTPPVALVTALREVFDDLYQLGRHTVRDELDAQRVEGMPVLAAATSTEREMDDRAGLAAHMVVTRIHEAVARRLLAGTTMLSELQLEAEREAKAALKAEADAHAAGALNAGRADEADANAEVIRGARYTSVLDKNRCPACAEADDDMLRPLDDPVRLARKPPNASCHGRGRCRCLEFYEFEGES